jgi:hypothetical protein
MPFIRSWSACGGCIKATRCTMHNHHATARAIFNQTRILKRRPRASIRINRVARKTIRVGQATKKHAMQALTNSNSNTYVCLTSGRPGSTRSTTVHNFSQACKLMNVAGWMLITCSPPTPCLSSRQWSRSQRLSRPGPRRSPLLSSRASSISCKS